MSYVFGPDRNDGTVLIHLPGCRYLPRNPSYDYRVVPDAVLSDALRAREYGVEFGRDIRRTGFCKCMGGIV